MRIGVDLGGTNIRAGLVDGGRLIKKEKVRCPSGGTCDEVLEAISGVINLVMEDGVESIGIGVPSVVDTKKGIVYNVANIQSWKEVPLKAIMQERFSVPVNINNDSNCFTLGECMFGQCRGYSNVIGLTIGTGVGSGVVIGGKLYEGNNAGAGEIGSLPYNGSDYESWCSTPFFLSKGTTGAEAAAKAAAGDAAASELWKEYGLHIGELIKAILYVYDPEAIVIGGGLAAAADLFKAQMQDSIRTFQYRKTMESVKIFFAENTDMALLGASALIGK